MNVVAEREPVETLATFQRGSPHPSPTPIISEAISPVEAARRLVRLRRARRRRFPEIKFEDHAWDMMLDLFIACEEGRRISVTSLCLAAQTSASTALRLVKRLEADGQLRRQPDPKDARRYFVELAPTLLADMRAEMGATASSFLI
jgi:hypothetical protein